MVARSEERSKENRYHSIGGVGEVAHDDHVDGNHAVHRVEVLRVQGGRDVLSRQVGDVLRQFVPSSRRGCSRVFDSLVGRIHWLTAFQRALLFTTDRLLCVHTIT